MNFSILFTYSHYCYQTLAVHGTIRKTFAQPDDDIFHTTQQAVIEEDIPKKLATRQPVQKKPLQPAPSKVKPTQQPKVKVKGPPPSVTG